MTGIGGLSSSTSNTITGLRGYGGLGSGLDRDGLIEGLTQGLQIKIDKQNQIKQKLQWQQDAYREISSKMLALADKYTSTFTSSTNLFSSSFWGAANISVLGANSKYVTATGDSRLAGAVSILGVKQLARNASMTSKNPVSDRVMTTGDISLSDAEVSNLAGKSIDIKFGDKTYSVQLPQADGQDYKYGTVEEAAASIQKAMEDISVTFAGGTSKKLSELVSVSADGDKMRFSATSEAGGNIVELKGGSALEALGFEKNADGKWEPISITKDGALSANAVNLTRTESFAERMGGKDLTFNYNGTSKQIKMPTREELEQAGGEKEQMQLLKDRLQSGLDDAFGKGRIQVDMSSSADTARLEFKTMIPGGQEDMTSILSISGGSAGLLGAEGSLHIQAGESNRLNLQSKIKDSGLNTFGEGTADADGKYKIQINGKEVEFSQEDSIANIMDRINSTEGIGVKVSYLQNADKFVVEATAEGASSEIRISGEGAKVLFGEEIDSGQNSGLTFNSVVQGQDAVIAVKYQGDDEVVELVRGSNSFSLEGMTVSVNGAFGYDEAGNRIADTEAVTFDGKADTEKIATAMKELVEQYNEILELVNKQVGIRPEKGYGPLTAAQKEKMSENEIKLWEEKAKQGIIYGSSELRSLAGDMRFLVGPMGQMELEKLGISVSNNWQDNGKLVFDEAKFKAAMEKDPTAVQEAFTRKANAAKGTDDGFAVKLKNLMDKYVNTLGSDEKKGILIRKAGSTKAPTSILNNALYESMKEVDKVIAKLQMQMKSKQDYYIRQFTTLETVIAQMNSQSSYLSSLSF